jgi:ankyrin repeat protein
MQTSEEDEEFDFDSLDWDLDDLEDLLQFVDQKDDQGMYLIHHAVRNSVPKSFLVNIVEKMPDCLVLKDKSMKLPLHHASHVDASDEIMEYLISQYNKGLRERDNLGMLPLHYLVGLSTSLKLLQLFERQYPESIREKDREGWLPLHHAARKNSSLEVLQFLVSKYPGSLTEATYHGSLPIHCAAYYNRDLAVNKFLTEQNPRALKMGGTNGMKPIHSAARNNSLEILQFFINQFPLGLYSLDNQERLPIHYAIKNPDSFQIVSFLANLLPECVKKCDSNRWLPLHCASRSSESIDLIELLISIYPEALKIPDNQGWLPIFHAAKCNKSFEIIRYLYEQFPEAVLVRLNDDVFCHELAPVASNQRNFLGLQFMALDTGDEDVFNEVMRVHICGDRSSGKSTICNMMKEILLESFNIGGIFDKPMEYTPLLKSANLGTTTNSMMNQTNGTNVSSTSNMQQPNTASSSIKVKSSNDQFRIIVRSNERFSHYLLHDYGGQAGYHVNYSNFLALSNSVYILTIPLYDKINKQKYNLDYLLERMFYWLKFLYSTAHSIVGPIAGSSKAKPQIPLLFVLNSFAGDSKASNEEIQTIKRVLFQEAMSLFRFKTFDEFLYLYDLDLNYLNNHCDFVLLGNEPLALDLSIKQNIRKLTETVKKSSILLRLPMKFSSPSIHNSCFLYDTSAPFFSCKNKKCNDINPFYNLIRESKLTAYCWDVLSLLDLSLIMLEDDFHLMLTSTIRTFFHKMLNYKDYKIKPNLQSIIEEELYCYTLNYFIFIGKVMLVKRKKSVLPPLNLVNSSPAEATQELIDKERTERAVFEDKSLQELATMESAEATSSSEEDNTRQEKTISDELSSGGNGVQAGNIRLENALLSELHDNHPHTSEECYRFHVLQRHEQQEEGFEYIVVTSPHSLMNNVLDLLIDKLIVEIRHNKKQLLLTSTELESWFKDISNSSLPLSILELLVSLRVALPVYYNEQDNSQMIRLINHTDVSSAGDSSSDVKLRYYWLYQLTTDKIPGSLDINYEFVATITNFNHLHTTDLLATTNREIGRVFLFNSPKFFFFPAWFNSLFYFILHKIPNVLHFNIYADGILVVSKEIGVVVQPFSLPIKDTAGESERIGFNLKIVSSLKIDLRNRNNYFNDFIWNLLNEFRHFIFSSLWNYSLQELSYHPSISVVLPTSADHVELFPVEDLERKWFSQESFTKIEFETFFGIHAVGYEEIVSNSENLDYKLVYLMRSSSPKELQSSSRWSYFFNKSNQSDKIESILGRILFASKRDLLFKSEDKTVLTIDNLSSSSKKLLVQLIMEAKRPEGVGTFSGHKIHDLFSNQHLIVCYTILTRFEVFQLINKAIEIFRSLDEKTSVATNRFVKRLSDFPIIPIVTYSQLSSSVIVTSETTANISQSIQEEIIIPEDKKLLHPSLGMGDRKSVKAKREATEELTVAIKSCDVETCSEVLCYRIHFLCPVCGKKANSGKDGAGYPLTLLHQWSENLLEVLLISVKIFVYLTNVKPLTSSNQTIPEIAYLLQDTIEILLSQLDKQFNPLLPSDPSDQILSKIRPEVFHQLQKKIFYLMKNYSVRSHQNLKKLRENIFSLMKIPGIPRFSSAFSPQLSSSSVSAALQAEKRRTSAFNFFGLGSSSTTTTVVAPVTPVQTSSQITGSNISSIITEDDLQNLATSGSFTSVINELMKFAKDGRDSTHGNISNSSDSLINEEVEKLISFIPVDGEKYFEMLKNFMTTLDDEYIVHSGLMRVENERGEIAYVCPPVASQPSLFSSGSTNVNPSPSTSTAVMNADGSAATVNAPASIGDFNWNYEYKRDNLQFKSSCAEEFLQRGKRCLLYRFQE